MVLIHTIYWCDRCWSPLVIPESVVCTSGSCKNFNKHVLFAAKCINDIFRQETISHIKVNGFRSSLHALCSVIASFSKSTIPIQAENMALDAENGALQGEITGFSTQYKAKATETQPRAVTL